MSRALHPFPARMAPDLAIRELRKLGSRSKVVLDPMAGSGTVLREATAQGHRAIGFDLDPLAVLIARVATRPVSERAIVDALDETLKAARGKKKVRLPWIDDDQETRKFIRYWFAPKQKAAMRRLAWALQRSMRRKSATRARARDVLRVALSRIVVTKDVGASLGRDVSHSRPQRVRDTSPFDVFAQFERSARAMCEVLKAHPPTAGARITPGDARHLPTRSGTVDLVMTSPPYLNAIDYMRGHRLSLVWLGYSVSELRAIRSVSIGSERKSDRKRRNKHIEAISLAMTGRQRLPRRQAQMVYRYAGDALRLMAEISRTLRDGGRAVLVVGNSCLGGRFIRNSDGIVAAANRAKLKLVKTSERELPENLRYLPLQRSGNSALESRMRTETVLTFLKSA